VARCAGDARLVGLGAAARSRRHAHDERVPTLAEVLDVAAPSAVEVLPEVKSDVSGAPSDGLEVACSRRSPRVASPGGVVQSFDPAR